MVVIIDWNLPWITILIIFFCLQISDGRSDRVGVNGHTGILGITRSMAYTGNHIKG